MTPSGRIESESNAPGERESPACRGSRSARSTAARGETACRLVPTWTGCAGWGNDTLRGGDRPDRLFGGEGDRIDARGGGFDIVGCGPGIDRVTADRSDLVGVDCETVAR